LESITKRLKRVYKVKMERFRMRRKYNKHHPYSKKHRQFGTETKRVKIDEHRAYHQLVGDKDPINALCYIILNFMPEDMKPLMQEVKKYGETNNLPGYLSIIARK